MVEIAQGSGMHKQMDQPTWRIHATYSASISDASFYLITLGLKGIACTHNILG